MNLITIVFLIITHQFTSNVNAAYTDDMIQLSQDFLIAALKKENTKPYRTVLSDISVDYLKEELSSDDEKLVFWINVYNAYIQHFLQQDPNAYINRSKFFSSNQIPAIGRMISFDKIEHGFLRRSQWKFGLGNIRVWFRPEYERHLRVDELDNRIHFILNCGAKSCPPVRVLNLKNLEEQLKESTDAFLNETTTYDAESNIVNVTTIMSWFRGDFGNKGGIKLILKNHNLIPDDANPKIKFSKYDWTLDLDNFILD